MHSYIATAVAALLLTSTLVHAQFSERGEGCTTLHCQRHEFMMKEREKLNEMQLDLMEMLMDIQTMNEQEAYYAGLSGVALQQPHRMPIQ
ncbi:expressed conserved protein [Echinococcus multilocularis]|uniref:Expressed conserved protein n=1 Tax=Echinococcus multilocularis TaxID=6211 RepID=U6HF78_ECHMU|nr:expressed conserved protein [Echinococcus multilocularis]